MIEDHLECVTLAAAMSELLDYGPVRGVKAGRASVLTRSLGAPSSDSQNFGHAPMASFSFPLTHSLCSRLS
jgi:hypothetical protein